MRLAQGGSICARANTRVSPSTPCVTATRIASTPAISTATSRISASIHYCMDSVGRWLARVNTVLYGCEMSDRLAAADWVKAGLKALAADGVGALKADLLAKSLGISRGSFYWHFADIG